jgi:hypothetical protein
MTEGSARAGIVVNCEKTEVIAIESAAIAGVIGKANAPTSRHARAEIRERITKLLKRRQR